MNDVKPRLSGLAAAAVACVAIVALAVLEGIALSQGIDGTQFIGVAVAIASIGGAAVGIKVGDIFRR